VWVAAFIDRQVKLSPVIRCAVHSMPTWAYSHVQKNKTQNTMIVVGAESSRLGAQLARPTWFIFVVLRIIEKWWMDRKSVNVSVPVNLFPHLETTALTFRSVATFATPVRTNWPGNDRQIQRQFFILKLCFSRVTMIVTVTVDVWQKSRFVTLLIAS
jgi:hypothetical protein